MAATCSTSKRRGSGNTYLSSEKTSGKLRYTCECAGVSTYGAFKPTPDQRGNKYMECVIHIWECPL